MICAYIGLGANLNAPLQQLAAAVASLSDIPNTTVHRVSGFYGSKPMGPQDQPDYVNAVAALHTELSAEQLLDQLQQIELNHGRERKAERWGPRTLDLDILLFGDLVIETPRLTVPHYGMAVREFVLYPLAEIAPDLQIPKLGPLSALLAQVPSNGLSLLQSP
jgi:2-amino-4-hydroxy-6-hydroxymethyldihydropteridine diphosphokinase